MNSPPRLRRGLTLLIAAFGASLALTYAWVLPRLVLDTEDRVFGRNLDRLRAEAGAQRDAGGELTAPGARAVYDLNRESPELAAFLRSLAPGVHEFNDDPLPGLATTELLVAAEPGPSGEPEWWVLYDVAGLEALEGPWSLLYLGAVGGGFVLALAATFVGLVAARRIFRALADLENLLASAQPSTAEPSAAELRDDEVGRMARRWRSADSRLRSALERERRFTRDASHELRTPVAAARGALELLRAEPGADGPRRAELLGRIDASLFEMGDLVHAFLWLAREPAPAPAGLDREEFVLADAVDRLVSERNAASGPKARIHVARRSDVLVEGSERLARVVLGNILGNALVHGAGDVRVEVLGPRVSVENRWPSTGQAAADGFGFGLAIAADLCARFGWRLTSKQGDGVFRVLLEFAPEGIVGDSATG